MIPMIPMIPPVLYGTPYLYGRCKYKGIAQCLVLLTRAMSGNYVNFGVFVLYGDRALSDCLEVIISRSLLIKLR